MANGSGEIDSVCWECGEFRLDSEAVLSPSVDSGGGLKYIDIQGIRVQALLKGMSMVWKGDSEGIILLDQK